MPMLYSFFAGDRWVTELLLLLSVMSSANNNPRLLLSAGEVSTRGTFWLPPKRPRLNSETKCNPPLTFCSHMPLCVFLRQRAESS